VARALHAVLGWAGEAAFLAQVEIFDGGREREAGRADATAQSVVCPARAFDINEQAKAVFEGEFGVLGILQLFFKRGAKAGQAQRSEFIEQRLSKHRNLLNGNRLRPGCWHGR